MFRHVNIKAVLFVLKSITVSLLKNIPTVARHSGHGMGKETKGEMSVFDFLTI